MRKHEIDFILNELLDSFGDISDINITVGKPLQVEVSGKLKGATLDSVPIMSLSPFQTEIFAINLIGGNPRLMKTLLETGSCDCSYQLGDRARFRVNIFSQRGSYSIVLRKLSTYIPSIDEMNLPKTFYKIADELNGLILVTGSTGSGKSTSLATMLRHINQSKAVHVITLEDPMEFEHPHAQATFNQRELGIDFDSFANGLKAALRQAPKIILVGEIRDRETMEIALTASETGHLVLSTLHTIDAGQTINRITGLFEKEEEQLIRMRLAESLRWIVCQRLVPAIGGGRRAVLEVMNNNMRIHEVVLNGESEDKQFYEIIEQGTTYGMQTFDQNLLDYYKKNIVTEETVITYCSRKSAARQGLDKIKAAKGIDTSDIKGLSMAGGTEKHHADTLPESFKKARTANFPKTKTNVQLPPPGPRPGFSSNPPSAAPKKTAPKKDEGLDYLEMAD